METKELKNGCCVTCRAHYRWRFSTGSQGSLGFIVHVGLDTVQTSANPPLKMFSFLSLSLSLSEGEQDALLKGHQLF